MMKKMRRLFLKLSMLLFVLGMSTNVAWADEATVYFASLKAQTDPASTGSGQVKLTWLDITGKPLYVDFAKQINYLGFGEDATWMAKETVYDGPAATAQILGGTMIAIEGTEVAMEIGGTGSQIYMTSFVYFHAESEPANGSYLADWTFTDPQITRMTSEMNPSDPMGGYNIYGDEYWDDDLGEWVTPIIEEVPYRTPCFKVLPKIENSAAFETTEPVAPTEPQESDYSDPEDYQAAMQDYADAMEAYIADMQHYAQIMTTFVEMAQDVVQNKYNTLYALFSKYLLSNPVATNANLEAVENAEAHLTVTVEINGDAASLDAEDFGTFTFTNNSNSEWAYDLDAALAAKEVISEQKTRITIPVTYTYKNTGYGLKNTTMTISMAGDEPSTLNVNLSVDALNPTRPEAFLLNGKDDASPISGSLEDILATDISGYSDPIVKLNKPVATDLTFSGKDFTLDLNGNTAQAITVSGGNVTIAYSKYGGSATSLTVNGGKAILNGGTFGSLTIGTSGIVEQNGATISGAAENNGSLTATDGTILGGLTSSKTLVINGGTFKGATAVTVSGGTAAINRGAIEGTTCGLKVTGGAATTKKLAAIKGATYSAQQTGGTLTVESGKFDGPLNGTIDFIAGFFKTNTYGISTEGKTEMNVSAGVEYNEGYRYFLGTSESALANGVGVCRIGTTSYAKLEDAIAYANNNPSVENIVIFMTNDYTLPAGYYTLPANATIVVPMSDSQEKEINMTAPRVVFNDVNNTTPYASVQPTEFRRLTFASGVNMDMFGDIELTCSQYASNEAYTAQPCGAYGRMVLEEGSHITLQDGSEFRAWGFVTGKGEMDARRGAKVREMFQLGDWKGAFTSVEITGMAPEIVADHSAKKIFPVTQYFIQNIESPVKYHPGAVLSTSATVSEGLLGMSVSMAATDIAVVGVRGQHEAIFLMDQMADADNTWVRKWYDSENDIQVYDINSAAHIGSMVLDMGDINLLTYGTVPVRLNSAHFDLPLTSNFKIHLLSGTMDFKQNTSLLPGAEVDVDKESTVTVAKDNTDTEHTGALYVYDAEDWDKYAYCNEYNGSSLVKSRAYTKTVRYAPSWNGRPTVRDEQTCPPDAAINVHGTFMTATGFVYTSEHGANIFSSNEDAGTFIFNENASGAGTRTVWNVKGSGTFESRTFYPARLKHGDGTHENTSTAEAGDAYCYQEDLWTIMKVADDPCFMEDNHGNYYAKPADYVKVVVTGSNAYGFVGNADHTFSDAAGTGRLFILTFTESGDCDQWWEVEKKDNLYHCIHPQNDTYYYWEGGDEDGQWKEKTYTITWKNWDGTIIQTIGKSEGLEDSYEVTYGTMAEFFGTNPTREKDADSTYNFTGWKPALGPVTQDVIYTATFQGVQRKYTIIFQNEGGTEIERQFLTHNEMPVCENTPTKVGHILQWSPAIGKVVADATYIATWLEEPPTKYEIRFLDYDGTVLKSDSVAVGDTPEAPAFPSNKPATAENTYTCSSWDAEVVPVTEAATYTAVYTPTAKTFTVTFLNEDGSEIEHHDYKYGETPVCSATPTKPNTAEYTYGFAWTPQIQTVQGAATYRATFPATLNRYTVTLKSNLSGVCTFTGAGTYDYGTEVNIGISYDSDKYNFLGWEDEVASTSRSIASLEADVTYTANFSIKSIVNLEVEAGQTIDLDDSGTPTEVNNFVLTSNGTTSGQVVGSGKLDIKGEAIFRLEQTFNAATWYAVAVPWRVDPNTGIYNASGVRLTTGAIYVIEFDANAYASADRTSEKARRDYWKFLDETGNDMVPGKLYMVYLAAGTNALEFHKKAGAALQTRQTAVVLASGSEVVQSNWNAIANPALYHANMDAGVDDYQVFNNGGYTPQTDLSSTALIVGAPIFVQVPAPNTVYANVAGGGASPAPAYRHAPQTQSSDNRYTVELSSNGQLTDRLIVQTAEEKANEYVIGKDLAKMGISTKVAQMWMERYDAKLCKNTVEWTEERADYPLSIYAPNAGEYTLSAMQNRGDMTLYLTYNGEAIWNLSDGAYVANLSKGTDANYGLRISAKAPQTATGMDEAVVDSKDAAAYKVLINNQVFIIRGNNVYSIDGQLVK